MRKEIEGICWPLSSVPHRITEDTMNYFCKHCGECPGPCPCHDFDTQEKENERIASEERTLPEVRRGDR